MCRWVYSAALGCLFAGAALARAGIIANFTVDAGGRDTQPLEGLSAEAVFSDSGRHLSILLENTSTGLPKDFDVADSLLVSLGMNLPADVWITEGEAALIGPDAHGLGSWSHRKPGTSVADQWLWTNLFGRDLLDSYRQVITTAIGDVGFRAHHFEGGFGNVSGPYGGIAANPPLLSVPGRRPAVSGSILFELNLNKALTPTQLSDVAGTSIVEFGSDARYLRPVTVPEPAATLSLLAALGLGRRRG